MKQYPNPLFLSVALLFCCSCNNTQNGTTAPDTEEPVVISTDELADNYSAWTNLSGEYVDIFGVTVAEPVTSADMWRENRAGMSVIVLENRTTGQREGFLNKGDIYSLTALNELIAALEDIGKQVNTQTCRYKTKRQYITSHGISINCIYDGSQWSKIHIQYSNDSQYGNNDDLTSNHLSGYIDGLKSCVQFIKEFKEKKWNNVSAR